MNESFCRKPAKSYINKKEKFQQRLVVILAVQSAVRTQENPNYYVLTLSIRTDMASVAQMDVHLTGDQEVTGLIPSVSGNILS